MATKNMVENSWEEDMRQFLYQLGPDTTKITRSLESKHTPGMRKNNPYINQLDQPKVIYTGDKSDFKSH